MAGGLTDTVGKTVGGVTNTVGDTVGGLGKGVGYVIHYTLYTMKTTC
jgi:hypothetical protein